ncbi:MAG: carboxypeptidase regulatory-like domain-containing protein, partial [Chloroflexota bacterium]
IHDSLTRFSYAINSAEVHDPASKYDALLSSDGRSLLYANQNGNLTIYNRVFNKIVAIELPFPSVVFALSDDGNTIVFMVENSANNYSIFSYQVDNHQQKEIASYNSFYKNPGTALSLSNNGNYLFVREVGENKQTILRGYNLTTDQQKILEIDPLPMRFSSSNDGSTLAYAQEFGNNAQIFIYDQVKKSPSYVLSGRVTDATGLPLALVTLESNYGNQIKTDRQGYFWINDINPGKIKITPSKEGYSFDPPIADLNISADISDISFTVSHDQTLSEAQLDIGMPYDFERGCTTPWQGCGGDFHGFSAGYCTDLILDSYTWGVDFNIQTALVHDYQAHPEHFYRWRNSRNAHDMWRFFAYSGQILSHSAGYLPGDIVFFDWSGDGEIDHVNIVSEVNIRNQPVRIYDATGIINSNPGGLTDELPWQTLHELTVRGHARWNGIYSPTNTVLPINDFLQISAASVNIELTIIDSKGNKLSQSKRDMPNGSFFDLGWEQSASIISPQEDGKYYTIQISTVDEDDINYALIMHTIQAGLVTERVERKSILGSDSTETIYLRINSKSNGDLGFNLVRGIRKVYGDWHQ